MLQKLIIKNYALIEETSIDFSNQLNVITGETGAGKSILLGALSLLAGQRADTQILRDKNTKCTVEGWFDINSYNLQHFFEINEIDYDNLTIIRREITPNGKSRAFVNDMPVTLLQLKTLADKLINIHSQHETIELHDETFQMAFLDAYAQNQELVKNYQQHHKQYNELKKQLQTLTLQAETQKQELDYHQFLLEELEKIDLENIDQTNLENQQNTLEHAENIKQNLTKIDFIINNDQQSLMQAMYDIKNTLQSISIFNTKIEQIYTRFNELLIELKDISQELDKLNQNIVFDNHQLQIINEQLNVIYHLQQKHKVQSVEQLLKVKNELQEKVSLITSFDEQIQKLENLIQTEHHYLTQTAQTIRVNRQNAIEKIERHTIGMLQSLGMPNAIVKFELTPQNHFQINGMDKLTILFTANKGVELKPISKIASGGELARVMLTIKALLSRLTKLPTIIFDEIDTGVSGDVANRVGEILEKMAQDMQVIAITHLPQIACKGTTHFLVYKQDNDISTTSQLKKLSPEERITEISKMLSGAELTQTAIEHAKNLLQLR